jgi:hypothetical protein
LENCTRLEAAGRLLMTRNRLRVLTALTAILAITLVAAPEASAQPINDDFANATLIPALPFSDSVDISTATTEFGEPTLCGASTTVWYSITPTSAEVLRADSFGSNFLTNLSIYRADGPGLAGLTWVNCGSFGNPVVFQVQAGTTYYIQGGSIFGDGGTLNVHVDVIPPPPNDQFADALPVTSVPFSDTQDITGAMTEAGEPVSSCNGDFITTVWYTFTPTTSGSYSVSTFAPFSADVDVYTGTSLGDLTRIACGGSNSGLGTFHADAGTTYYLQAGSWVRLGSLETRLELTPPPAVGFVFGTRDPSIFDTVQFFSTSFDPANVGIETQTWDFGDGATAAGCCPTHRYAADGDYTVELMVTTFDGRTASSSQVVQVRTHDVAIARFLSPMSASVGQTRTITVGITNHRYPEDVEVQLFRSIPGGFQQVDTLTKHVSVLSGNRTTTFAFSYTFTSDDASLGKITFKAVATIVNVRDALPADNEAIAPPTRVN